MATQDRRARIAQLQEAQERREARDSYRAAGGSKRRPLRSFLTDQEKREAREAHAARIAAAVAELESEAGFEAWAETMALNPQLTPMNAALVALQTPGEIIGTAAAWRRQGYRVRTGERAAGRITGRGFWPLAYFTAEQASATDLLDFEPERPQIAGAREELVARLGAGEKSKAALEAVAARCIRQAEAVAA